MKNQREGPEVEPLGLLPPEETPPVDVEEFAFAFRVGTAAGHYRLPMRGPGTYPLTIENEDESLSRLVPTDIPLNRFIFTILDQFGDDRAKTHAIVMRFWAFLVLMGEGAGEGVLDDRWMKDSEDDPEAKMLHPAVIEAIATQPLNSDGNFDKERILERIQQIAHEKYEDE